MKGKSLGWILLIGALAVPAVLFFKWWSQMKASQAAESRQAPAASAPFGGEAAAAPLPAPKKDAAPAAAPVKEAAAPPPALPSNAKLPVDEGPPATAPKPIQAVSKAPASDAPPTASGAPLTPPAGDQPPARPGEGQLAQRLEYMPKTNRDPMLSVFDLREIMKKREQERLAQEQLQRAAEELKNPKPVEEPKGPPPKPLCDNFELQGIVATPDGISALINDRVISEGQTISGAVVERITTRTVVFKKGRKTCMKRVSK